MSRNIFLDLGTHYGQGLDNFYEMFSMNDDWIICTFEANPVTFKKYMAEYHGKYPNVAAINVAISDTDGKLILNLEQPPREGETGMGSSAISLDKWNPWNTEDREHFKTQVEVPCIDFSKFIKQNFTPEDNIIIKMDIEGSEYCVLDKMIADDTISYVNHIFIEWHSRFFTNTEEMQQKEISLREQLSSYDGLKVEYWK